MPASAGEKGAVLGCLARAEGARDSDGWTRAGGKPRALSQVCLAAWSRREVGRLFPRGSGGGNAGRRARTWALRGQRRRSPGEDARFPLSLCPRSRSARAARPRRPENASAGTAHRSPNVSRTARGMPPRPAARAWAATPPTSKPQPVQTPLPAAPRGASCGRRRVRPRGRASSVGATRLRRARELRSAGLGSHVHRRTRPPPRTALRVSRGP